MIRFLADADFNYLIVKGCRLREPAMDFLTGNEARLRRVPDPEVLALAAAENRILVSHDLRTMPAHFGDFLSARHSSPGVFLVSRRTPLRIVIEELVLIWAASDPDEWKNRIVRIPLP